MPENLETVNLFLRDNYGIDTDDGEPIWRIVFSDDQFEKRMMPTTDSGVALLVPEVRTVPKYPHVRGLFVLEQRQLVPEQNITELAGALKSYEPRWVFRDEQDNPVRPTILACQFIIDTIRAAMGKKSLARYKDPKIGDTPEETYMIHQARVQQLEEQLFGNESGLKGETTTGAGSAIIVPGPVSDKVH
jgi:hypothetical protein